MNDDDVVIRETRDESVARACARMMSLSEPWVTLRRNEGDCLKVLTRPTAQTYIALLENDIAGVVSLSERVPLLGGYISTLAVSPDHRNRGIGHKLLAFAETIILRNSANCFLCVSSFNLDAQRFYEREGYARVGELTDYLIAGSAEILMRRTTGPMVRS